jgi:hypothetical protein
MTFREDLASLINRHSLENGSDTPDFLLAEYLTDCLAVSDKAVTARERWYGREHGNPISNVILMAKSVAQELVRR